MEMSMDGPTFDVGASRVGLGVGGWHLDGGGAAAPNRVGVSLILYEPIVHVLLVIEYL